MSRGVEISSHCNGYPFGFPGKAHDTDLRVIQKSPIKRSLTKFWHKFSASSELQNPLMTTLVATRHAQLVQMSNHVNEAAQDGRAGGG